VLLDLRHVLNEYRAHYHAERPHQGKGSVILFPLTHPDSGQKRSIDYREGLGGLLKYYHCETA
jgi:hypothetical protein